MLGTSGLQYIELMLLKSFQYRGRYVNRLAAAGEESIRKCALGRQQCWVIDN